MIYKNKASIPTKPNINVCFVHSTHYMHLTNMQITHISNFQCVNSDKCNRRNKIIRVLFEKLVASYICNIFQYVFAVS